MRLITLDFETYYSREYSLSKILTEDYITSPLFEPILVGAKVDDNPTVWYTGDEIQIRVWLETFNLPNNALLCHHTMFDGLILAARYGIYPKMYFDTRLMAQAILKPYSRSVSLESCLKMLNLGVQKGTAVHQMIGRTRGSLSRQEMQDYASYCMDDIEGTYRLFKYLLSQFPRSELEVIDLTLRMYLQPSLELDATLLAQVLQEVTAKKAQQLASLPPHITKADLMSNPKFAEILKSYGIDPPMKVSPLTGKQTYAFAKTDTAFKELEEEWDDHPEVSAILLTRKETKSTIEITRAERLLHNATMYPKFRVPILYHAAHTGRDGGTEKLNIQNFPQPHKSRLRACVRAPKGHVVLGADLSQIEARITAFLAGQQNLLDGFRKGEDVYSDFISTATGMHTVKGRSKADDRRRFIGKTCVLGLGFGMGAERLRATLRKDDYKLELIECSKFVNVYRYNKYPQIPELWSKLDARIPHMASTNPGVLNFGPLKLVKNSIILPNGMALVYNNLRHITSEDYSGWVYDFAGETRTLWGGKVTENVVQALARIIIMNSMLRIKQKLGLRPAIRVHDELDYVVPVQYAEKCKAAIGKLMRVGEPWAPGLPIEVEINYGQTFGDCK